MSGYDFQDRNDMRKKNMEDYFYMIIYSLSAIFIITVFIKVLIKYITKM